jgi:hypothetical protein
MEHSTMSQNEQQLPSIERNAIVMLVWSSASLMPTLAVDSVASKQSHSVLISGGGAGGADKTAEGTRASRVWVRLILLWLRLDC